MRRILVHDFSGHPFQVQLSRELAGRGHEVLHVYCDSFVTGKGRLAVEDDDPPTFSVESIDLGETFEKYSARRRARQELAYAGRFVDVVRRFRPDVVIGSNDPLLAKFRTGLALRKLGVPYVFWLQDLYSVAMARELERRAGVAGTIAGRVPRAIEGWLLRRSAQVVSITPDFGEHLRRWRVASDRVTVIPNWAPLDELPVVPPSKGWARRQDVPEGRLALYAGTLGLKHRPEHLSLLAEKLAGEDVGVVVVSEGPGAEALLEAKRARGLDNLHVLPFQPWEEVPHMLAAADVLLTILEDDAGVFSVPSKLLTYLCAGRPIVAAVPSVNLAARILVESGAGAVADPRDSVGFAVAVQGVLGDEAARLAAGRAARAYAERNFDIEVIGERFEHVLAAATGRR